MLEELFQKLSIRTATTPPQRRVLLGFSDTEGTPHRKNSTSSLHDLVILFRYVVDAKTFDIIETVDYMSHVALPKNVKDTKAVKGVLKTHFDAIKYFSKRADCESVCIGYWNAPHDKAVLRHYIDELPFQTVDLLHVARQLKPGYKSYSLSHIAREHKIKVHTALGDTLRLIQVLEKLQLEPSLFLSFVK